MQRLKNPKPESEDEQLVSGIAIKHYVQSQGVKLPYVRDTAAQEFKDKAMNTVVGTKIDHLKDQLRPDP